MEGSDAAAVERAGRQPRDKNAMGILVVGVGATAATDGGCGPHFGDMHLGCDGPGPGGIRGTVTCLSNLEGMDDKCLSYAMIQSESGGAEYMTNESCNRAATRPVSPARDKGAGSTFVAGAVAAGKDGSGVRALFHINAYECLSIIDDFSCEKGGTKISRTKGPLDGSNFPEKRRKAPIGTR